MASIGTISNGETGLSVRNKLNLAIAEANKVALKLDASQKGSAGGVATLDATGKVPTAQLPDIPAGRKVVVADEAARLALPVHPDLTIAYQSDTGDAWGLDADSAPSIAANWTLLGNAQTGGVNSFNGRTGNVTPQAGDYNASQVGAIPATEKGTADGVATLDASGKVPAAQLPAAGIEDAPINGIPHNRKDGAWVPAASPGSGGPFTVERRNGSAAGQVHVFSLPAAQYAFDLGAFALKEGTAATNQSIFIETFGADSETDYQQTGALVWDVDLSPYTGQTYTTAPDGSFYSSPVRADGQLLSISSIAYTEPPGLDPFPNTNSYYLVPRLTSATTPSNLSISSSSDYSASFAKWMAFDREPTLGNWASNGLPTISSPQWLQVSFESPQLVTGYQLVSREDSASADSSPTDWTLEASNDLTTWVSLHTVVGAAAGFAVSHLFEDIGNTNAYSHYRLVITGTTATQYGVVVGQFNLITSLSITSGEPFLVRDGNLQYYSATGGALTQVATPATPEDIIARGTTTSGDIPISAIGGMESLHVVSSGPTTIITTYTPYNQIAFEQPRSVSAWSEINAATLTTTETGAGTVRVAVSRNGTDWYAWSGTAWVSLGGLAADTASADALLASGMSAATLNALTWAEWEPLFAGTEDGTPDALAFAYALSVPDPTVDAASISDLTINVDLKAGWELQSPSDVKITWFNDQVTFRTVSAGNYRFAYQTP
ncbi:discoidin domain-containing protein [Vreelandella lionensis]|uniref:Discoidin domain-containing protein n=1 Tax=Vreelandella lionensis TaxID=1144478 RepID=A0ABW8BNQ6_9GAMM